MTLKDGNAEEDSAGIEDLLAELEEAESNSRYDNLHSFDDSNTKTQLHTSIMRTHDQEKEIISGAPHALVHSHTDDMLPPSPSKFSHTQRVFAVDMPPSPPPSPPPCGCSCFLLPSHKRVVKQKKYSAEDQRSSKIKGKIQKGKAGDDDDDDDDGNDEWQSAVFREIGSQRLDAGGLFDVKSTEREFKRASMKEKQLTQEAQKFLNMVASS